jgi:hypothetical protein
MKLARIALAGLAMGWMAVWFTALFTTPAFAGPPFLTDDPEPVESHHYEFYTFSTLDRLGTGHGGGDYSAFAPAFEFNAGVARNLQLHIITPMALAASDSGPTTYGVGDVELGAKYRFVQEKGRRPQVGIFPMLELPTGDSHRNLGNGETWARLPLWLQKSWGKWTSYGGAGYIINRAPGMRDTIFAGWLVQRQLNRKLAMGIEWYDPGRQSVAGRSTQLVNAGGTYSFHHNFSLLFAGGHSFHGESHTVAYVGLYWTFGAKGTHKPSRVPEGPDCSPGSPLCP